MSDSAYSVARRELVAALANGNLGQLVSYGWPTNPPKEYVCVVDPGTEQDDREPHSLGTAAAPGHIRETFFFWVICNSTRAGKTSQEAVERREDLLDDVTTVVRANQGTISQAAAVAGVHETLITQVRRTETPASEGWTAQGIAVVRVISQMTAT